MSNPNYNSVEFDGIKPIEFDGIRRQAANLRSTRLFYLAFPNCDAWRHELSWTHCRVDFKEKFNT